jgi:hypothetical protein
MAETQLPAVTASGSQTDTQSPQTGGSYGGVANGASFQSGTPSSVLTSSNGISLAPTPVTTVSLGQASGSTAITPPVKHAFNPALLAISIGLFVIAVIMFKTTGDFGKKHNQYN